MPKINGVEAIEHFQAQYPHVPLIVLTGGPDTSMAVSFMRHGVVDYLVKPVAAERIISAVTAAMDQRCPSVSVSMMGIARAR